jgi:prolipoprotein diacylglyceryltransferase
VFPDFRYLIGALGVDAPQWLGLFKTFGLLVALSFLAAAWTLTLELKRKEAQGYFGSSIEEIEVGRPASPTSLLISGLIGFILGAKVGGFFGHTTEIMPDPLGYIFSARGSFMIGLLGAALSAGSKWWEKKKAAVPEPQMVKVKVRPHDRMTEILMIAAIAGFIGAKVFNAFESWDEFVRNPASLLASAGFTFYGGLITAAIALYFYVRKQGWDFRRFCDATAPGLILAYGIGRLGCQFAGDGDWGIVNSAYITTVEDGSLQYTQDKTAYLRVLSQPGAAAFAEDQAANGGKIEARHLPAPAGLPRWAVAMNYPKNVNNVGVPLGNCQGDYCAVLPTAVFPTPIYESIAGIGIFFLLWGLRKRIRRPLHLFGLYLLLNGLERFLVEQFRVNYKYNWGTLHPSQAEIISTCLMIGGVVILALYRPKPDPPEGIAKA